MRQIRMMFAGLAMLMLSCTGTQNKPEGNPDFAPLSDDKVVVSHEGGSIRIGYTLDADNTEGEIKAISNADWAVYSGCTDSEVIMEVEPNTAESSREAAITVVYSWKGGNKSFVIDLVQEGLEEEVRSGDFDVTITDVGASFATARIVPDDMSMFYMADAALKEDVDNLGDEAWIRNNLEYLGQLAMMEGIPLADYLMWIGNKGENTVKVVSLIPDKDYYMCVYGVSESADPVTGLSKTGFHTLVQQESDCTFDFDIDISGNDVSISVTPSDNDTWYYFDIATADTFNGSESGIRDYINELMDYFLNDLHYGLEDFASKGADSYVFTDLEPNTLYTVFVAAVDDGGRVSSDPVHDDFTTGERIVGNATVTVECDVYYDGEDVAAIYPDFAPYSSMAIVPAIAVTGGDAQGLLLGCYEGDLTDENYVSDDAIIAELKKTGTQASTIYFLPWDQESTFLAVAYDSEEHFGEVFRLCRIFDKEGASPAEDFTPLGTASARKHYKPGRFVPRR